MLPYTTGLFFRRDIRRECKLLEESPDTTEIAWQITSAAPEYTWNRGYGKYHRDNTSSFRWMKGEKSVRDGHDRSSEWLCGKPHVVQEEWYSLYLWRSRSIWRVYLAREYGRPYYEIDVCRDTESGLLSERRDLNESQVHKVHKVESHFVIPTEVEESLWIGRMNDLFKEITEFQV